MIAQGRVLLGLDEFMLRTGHLTLVCRSARDGGGFSHRAERLASEALTHRVSVTSGDNSLTEYLAIKGLVLPCTDPVQQDRSSRYEDLCIDLSTVPPSLRTLSKEDAVSVWWQDFNLAAAEVRSKVGALGVAGRSSSKSPLSHIFDWATILGLMNSSSSLSSEGHVLLWIRENFSRSDNLYALGSEAIVLAYLLFKGDFDVTARVLRALAESSDVWDKRRGIAEYLRIVQEIFEHVDTERLSAMERQLVVKLWRDVYKGGGSKSGSASTAWHRVSSRLETLTDIGLVEKPPKNGLYEYKYKASDFTKRLIKSFDDVPSADIWLEKNLLFASFGKVGTEQPLQPDELLKYLPKCAESTSISVGQYPIDSICLALCAMTAAEGDFLQFGAARKSIHLAARARPDVIRLARGSSGSGAEFMSIQLRKIAHGS